MKKFEKVEKIGYHSNFDFECNAERGSKESLSIALGPTPDSKFVNPTSLQCVDATSKRRWPHCGCLVYFPLCQASCLNEKMDQIT